MYAYQFRLIVVGDSTVGKSSLLRAFCDGKFSEDSDPTVGVDFYARIIEIKPDIRVKLQIWDTGKYFYLPIKYRNHLRTISVMINQGAILNNLHVIILILE